MCVAQESCFRSFGVGAMVFLLPGIIIAILSLFYLANILFNHDTAWGSIKHSFQLVWGWRFWFQTFAVVFIPSALMLAIGPLLSAIMGKNDFLGILLGDVVIATDRKSVV